jgi:penicillin-binding protein 1A
LPFPVAGKTGTTNDSKDAWFIGFTPDLVVGVYIGYDDPRPLGRRETGSSAAAPIFKDFMADAMKDETPQPFRTPPGIRLVQINAETGTRAQPGDERVIWEAFVPGEEPNDDIFILDANGISQIPAANFVRDGITDNPGLSTRTGTGGIY